MNAHLAKHQVGCLRARGFSLIEVALALGIVSFAVIGVIGLLPVGLKSMKESGEHAGAADTLQAITHSLRSATSADRETYAATFSGETITFQRGGSGTPTNTWSALTLEGQVPESGAPQRLAAVLEIRRQPGADGSPGEAVVSVAWSAMSEPRWDGESWTSADGSIASGVQFLPRE